MKCKIFFSTVLVILFLSFSDTGTHFLNYEAFCSSSGLNFATTPEKASEKNIPEPLKEWIPWVMYGHEDALCPGRYDDFNDHRCVWETSLDIELNHHGGRFSLKVLALIDSWVVLPGESELWPDEIKVDSKSVPVLERNSVPVVHVRKGLHIIEGVFRWDRMPEALKIPENVGTIKLSINEKEVMRPFLGKNGKLWLKRERSQIQTKLKVKARFFRLIDDTIPMMLTTLVMVDISGQPQEFVLKQAVLRGSIPMEVQSDLPTEIKPNGDIALQARRGRWEIVIKSRMMKQVSSIELKNLPERKEIWAFKPENDLRLVKLEGVLFIDPRQTDIPEEWKKYTTFLVTPGTTIHFKQLKRGDPNPPPDQLRITKTWWLDFDGKGFTVQDRINGEVNRSWYLVVNEPQILGRVTVNGEDRLITSFGKAKKAGIELRKGRLNLVSESRIEGPLRTIPAVGWNHDFQGVTGVLNLPPGWKLLAVQGADEVAGTWLEKWTLLDFFIVLIISLSILKLKGWKWFLVALIMLGITYHEPGSPRMVWLHIIISLAILSYVSIPWIRKVSTLWYWGSIIALLVISIPFMIGQIRAGFYPQLEHPRYHIPLSPIQKEVVSEREKHPRILPYRLNKKGMFPRSLSQGEPVEKEYYDKLQQEKHAVMIYDSAAMIQTGPGIPSWKWEYASLKWNGPVRKNQTVKLWLLSPRMNLVLSVMRVMFLVLLIIGLAGKRSGKSVSGTDHDHSLIKLKESKNLFFIVLVVCLLLSFSTLSIAGSRTYAYPQAEMLKELQQRLLEKPDCLPKCANISRALFILQSDSIRVFLTVQAEIKTAIPLPSSDQWLPRDILLDSKPAPGVSRDDDNIEWILVPEGIHSVLMLGNIPETETIQFNFPLRPKKVRVERGTWKVEGLSEEGNVGPSLIFSKSTRLKKKNAEKVSSEVPPFFEVDRTLSLALDWQVKTTVKRLTPPGTSAFVSVPLLDGESVMTSGVTVKNRKVLVNMAPAQTVVSWFSTLNKTHLIHLKAPLTSSWVESWVLDASPIWHCELSGIPVIHHRNQSGYWMPQWRPWPGETVDIRVTRLRGVPGKKLTIEGVHLEVIPGSRFSKSNLTVKVRSTKGEQHKIFLPPGSRLIFAKINGKSQPVKLRDGRLILPLRPGLQECDIAWYQDTGLSTITRSPVFDLGAEAVNADVSIKVPKSRWILWVAGPRFGPAVLFWSYLLVVIIAAVALGRYSSTPLNTLQWILLGIGLTQIPPVMAIAVVGWFILMGIREKNPFDEKALLFNCAQLLIFLVTVIALWCLYVAVKNGLLGIPDMQISGNGSSNFLLHWTQDRIQANMPEVLVVSLPMYVFRVLMLFWALWLAYSLLKWLKWGWECFGTGGFWKTVKVRRKEKPKPPPVPTLEKVD